MAGKFLLGINLDCNTRAIETWALGTEDKKFTDKDGNKAVKWIDENTMGLCQDGDDIEGFVDSINVHTADGVATGSVLRPLRGARQWVFSDDAKVGDYVVSAAQTAEGKPNADDIHPLDYKGVTKAKKGDGVNFKWRAVRAHAKNPKLLLVEAV